MNQTQITQALATLRIPRKGGHIDIVKVGDRHHGMVVLTDHGTSSCVDEITVFETTCVVNWGGTLYLYSMKDAARTLGEFVLTLSLGKTANWIKKNCTEVTPMGTISPS
jgi:hypothetical protein